MAGILRRSDTAEAGYSFGPKPHASFHHRPAQVQILLCFCVVCPCRVSRVVCPCRVSVSCVHVVCPCLTMCLGDEGAAMQSASGSGLINWDLGADVCLCTGRLRYV